MPMFNVFDIAGSGMSANALRLNVIASNMANADSVSSSVGDTYRARQPVFAVALADSFDPAPGSAGVRVRGIVESQAPLRSVYRPDHPMADEQGYIHMPNVNTMEEMANMIAASRSYQSNVEVINVSKQMLLSTLQMGK